MATPPTPRLLLVGTGPMAVEYAKVLQEQRIPFTVVGRGQESAARFAAGVGVQPIIGGLHAWLATRPTLPRHAIIAVSEDQLGRTALTLLQKNVKSILVEKPGGFSPEEIHRVAVESARRRARVFVAYNRRFYASVLKAEEIIHNDGAVTSFSFEFTEWSHLIAPMKKAPGVKRAWFLHNSTHVIDLAFFLGGRPKRICSFVGGKLTWHPTAIFAGAGVSDKRALFSYQANWAAPGRWGVEILTKKHRLIFRPMEKLHIQAIGSVRVDEVPIDDRLDVAFKPGLYRQVRSFLGDRRRLCTIREQDRHVPDYQKILGARSTTG